MDKKMRAGGRQKIEMKMIQNEQARINTFSKRKDEIFKKASELSKLYGADVGLILFSPTGKPYSFGSPSSELVLNRFLEKNPIPKDITTNHVEANHTKKMRDLDQQLNELLKQLEVEKEKGRKLDELEKERKSRGGLEAPIDELNLHELEQFKMLMEQLQKDVSKRLDEAMKEAESSSPFAATNPPHASDTFID